MAVVKKLLLSLVLLALLFTALLAPRLIGIKTFTTGDEPAWLIFGHNFLHAVNKGQYEKTVYEYHPAVTSMWLIAAAIKSYFPSYTTLRHGYFDKFSEIDALYEREGLVQYTVLYRSRMLTVFVTSAFLLLSFALLRRLAGIAIAVTAILLVAFDPFYLGQSRLLNHEGLACAFALASFLALMVYLYKGRKLVYLLISGAACGLALLTKSTMFLLIGLAGLMFLVSLVEEWREGVKIWKALGRAAAGFLGWFAVLALVYVAFWPGMWVDPGKMLYEIYGNAFSYAFQGKRLQVTQQVVVKPVGVNPSDFASLLSAIFYKSTPLAWLGAMLAVIGLFDRKHAPLEKTVKRVVIYLATLVMLFILLFGLAQGRNSPHYLLMVFVCLDVMAGVGFVWGDNAARGEICLGKRRCTTGGYLGDHYRFAGLERITAIPVLLHLHRSPGASLAARYTGPGCGLRRGAGASCCIPGKQAQRQEAHRHLAHGHRTVLILLPGHSHPLAYQSQDYLNERSTSWLRQSDYLVIYDIQQRQMNMPAKLLAALEGVEPEHIIRINGLRYASIYKVSELPQRVMDSLHVKQ